METSHQYYSPSEIILQHPWLTGTASYHCRWLLAACLGVSHPCLVTAYPSPWVCNPPTTLPPHKRPRHLTNSQTTQRNSAQIRVTPSNTTHMSPFRPATHRFEVAHSIRICRSLFLLLWGGPTVRFSTRRLPQDRADPGNPWTHPRLR